MQNSFEKSFTIPGCGAARFGTLGAFKEFGEVIRHQQVAVVARRAALARGDDADSAEALLIDDLLGLGMDQESIQEHLKDPWKDVDGLYVSGADLIKSEG